MINIGSYLSPTENCLRRIFSWSKILLAFCAVHAHISITYLIASQPYTHHLDRNSPGNLTIQVCFWVLRYLIDALIYWVVFSYGRAVHFWTCTIQLHLFVHKPSFMACAILSALIPMLFMKQQSPEGQYLFITSQQTTPHQYSMYHFMLNSRDVFISFVDKVEQQ